MSNQNLILNINYMILRFPKPFLLIDPLFVSERDRGPNTHDVVRGASLVRITDTTRPPDPLNYCLVEIHWIEGADSIMAFVSRCLNSAMMMHRLAHANWICVGTTVECIILFRLRTKDTLGCVWSPSWAFGLRSTVLPAKRLIVQPP